MNRQTDTIEEKRKKQQEWMEELEKARERGMKQGIEMVTHGQYIEVEKLRHMTISELMNFIGFDD